MQQQNSSQEGNSVQKYLHTAADGQLGRKFSSKLSSYSSRIAVRKDIQFKIIFIQQQNSSQEGNSVQNYLETAAEWQLGRKFSSKLSSYSSRWAVRKKIQFKIIFIQQQNCSQEGYSVQNHLHTAAEQQLGRKFSSKVSSYSSRWAVRKEIQFKIIFIQQQMGSLSQEGNSVQNYLHTAADGQLGRIFSSKLSSYSSMYTYIQ